MELKARYEVVNRRDSSWKPGVCPFCKKGEIEFGDVFCGDCGGRLVTIHSTEPVLHYNHDSAGEKPLVWTILVEGPGLWLPRSLSVDGASQPIELERPLTDGESLSIQLDLLITELTTSYKRFVIEIYSNLEDVISTELNVNEPLLQVTFEPPRNLFRGPTFEFVGSIINSSPYPLGIESIHVGGDLAERLRVIQPEIFENITLGNGGDLKVRFSLDLSGSVQMKKSISSVELTVTYQACGYSFEHCDRFNIRIHELVPAIDEYLGIDFGTSGCCAAIFYKTKGVTRALTLTEHIADESGRIMPSTLIVNADGRIQIGWDAENMAAHLENSENARVVRSLKSSIATSEIVEVGSRSYTMEELSSVLFEELLWKVAKANDGRLPLNISFALPVSFFVTRRETIRKAFFEAIGRIQEKGGVEFLSGEELNEALTAPIYNAGGVNLSVIYEPCALAFVHSRYISGRQEFRQRDSHVFLVYDFGAGTLDISVMNLTKDDPSGERWNLDWVTVKNGNLGGNLIDELLMRRVWDACVKNDDARLKNEFEMLKDIVKRKRETVFSDFERALSIWTRLEDFVRQFKEKSLLVLPLQLDNDKHILYEEGEELAASLSELIKNEVRKTLDRARLAYRVAAARLPVEVRGGFEQIVVVLGGRMCLNSAVQEVLLEEIEEGKVYLGAGGRELRKVESPRSVTSISELEIQDASALKTALAEGAALYSYRITTAAPQGGGTSIFVSPYWNKLPFDIAYPTGDPEITTDSASGRMRTKTHYQIILEAGEAFKDMDDLKGVLPLKLLETPSPNLYFGNAELWMADHLEGEVLFDDDYDHRAIVRLSIRHNEPEVVLQVLVKPDLNGEVVVRAKGNGPGVGEKVLQRANFNEIV